MSYEKVLLTGGSGFVGSAVLDRLLDSGRTVHALTRDSTIDRPNVKSFVGGLFNPSALAAAANGCDAVIHLVGIIKESGEQTFEHVHVEGTARVIEAAKTAGIKRLVHMSALGAKADSQSVYSRTKFAAEERVRSSELDHTIFRPSMIHGPRGEFMKMLAGWAKGTALPYAFMPFFGRGVFGLSPASLQPIFVDDVARCFVEALDHPETIGQSYDLGGPETFTWPEMYDTAAHLIAGKTKLVVGLPAWYGKLVASLIPGRFLPFNKSQVVMAVEDNVADPSVIEKTFGFKPQRFPDALRSYVEELKK
ncbi:MAG TPA: complex I NDUFA9 subunit family protein [Tepidisphaeraceae bacterium]